MPVSPSRNRQHIGQPQPQSRNTTQQQRAHDSVQPHEAVPKKRVVEHVAIPIHHSDLAPTQADVQRPQKRRRSNDGVAVPVCDVPAPQKRSTQHVIKQQAAPVSSPLTELNSSQLPPTPEVHIDYQAVLLALADEYISAAYSMSASLATSDEEDLCEEYHIFISTAMGCLESVLINYRQIDNRTEARIRLRLATLMVEETNNVEEVEQVLSKGIALCERSRLSDLKYAMHYLLVRLNLKTSPKAALKAIDKLVQEVEALKLMRWVYVFRFLRVTTTLHKSKPVDTSAALKHLTVISTMAESERDISVLVASSVLEAMSHLKSNNVDAADLAQRAMAAARTHQLSAEMQQLPQLCAMLDFLDLSYCLTQFQTDKIETKLGQLHANLDTLIRKPGWNKDGTFLVETTAPANDEVVQDTSGILGRSTSGHATLTFRWATKGQIYALGYMLSGLAKMLKSAESSKAEEFFKEGLKLCQQLPNGISRSLNNALDDVDQRLTASTAIRLHMVFALCSRFEWTAAQEYISKLKAENIQQHSKDDGPTLRIRLYLEALCKHGLGELQEALDLYASPLLAFDGYAKIDNEERDIRLMATLNSILILRTLDADGHVKAENRLSAIEPHCLRHANAAIKAAYYIIRTTADGSNGAIMKTKQYLQVAIDAAKASSNNQLLSMVMNVMTGTLFTNIVGEQAEKSARAAVSLARKSRHPLWMAVANGMYGDIMERCGKADEALTARTEARNLIPALPQGLKNSLTAGTG